MPDDPLQSRKAADLWERLVSQGRSESDATAIVERVFRAPKPSRPGQAAALGAAQGLTFNMADEGAGVLSALAGRGYEAGRDKVRALQADLQETNPTQFGAGAITGAVGGALAGGAALRGVLGGARALGAASGGAAAGALQGFGSGEGTQGSLTTAALGGLAGGAMGAAAGALVPWAARKIVAARPAVNEVAARVSPVLARVIGGAAPKDATDAVRTALVRRGAPQATARAPVADEAVGGAVPVTEARGGMFGAAPSAADHRILAAMEADRLPVGAATQAAQANPTVSLPDLSTGEALRREGRRSINISPAAGTDLKQAARGRLLDAPTVLEDALTRTAGKGRINVYNAAEDAREALSKAATPLYDAARAKPFPEALLPEFNALMEVPQFRRAYQYATDVERLRGADVPTFADPDALPIPTIGTVDLMKRGVDRIIRGDLEREGVSREMGKAMNDRLRTFLGKLDEAVPEYRAARQYYRGGAEITAAFEQGAAAKAWTPDRIANATRDLSDGEREAFRSGLLAAVREGFGAMRDGGDIAARVLGSPALRAKMRQTFPDEASFRAFADVGEGPSVTGVRRTATAYGGNSTTTQQLLDVLGQTAGEKVSTARKVVGWVRDPAQAAGDAADWAAGFVDRGTAEAVAKRLNLTGPELLQYLAELKSFSGPEAARRAAARSAGWAAGAAAVPAGRALLR